VDKLEARYAAFDGLNLSFETREGILKHCSPRHAERLLAAEPEGPAWRFVHGGSPSLEAQLVNLADELAYSAHDADDGVRSGLITLDQLLEVPLVARHHGAVRAAHPAIDPRRALHETLRRMLSEQIQALVSHTRAGCEAAARNGPLDAEGVRRHRPLVGLPPALRDETLVLKRMLFQRLYRHPQVMERTGIARRVLAELFEAYRAAPNEMSPDYAGASDDPARTVADYVAGMTDRFALREHHRLTGQRLFDW
jgi:dGTPase